MHTEVLSLNLLVNNHKLTQRSLAEICDVSQVTISRMLKGQQPVTVNVIKSICHHFKLNITDFINGNISIQSIAQSPLTIQQQIDKINVELALLNHVINKSPNYDNESTVNASIHTSPSLTGTRTDIMNRLKISSSTFQRLTHSGELKSFKIGASVRYKWTDIEAYLNNK